MQDLSKTLRGRGVSKNLPNRFKPLSQTIDDYCHEAEDSNPETVFIKDVSKSILSKNDSPDIPFESSLNPYRGCEHGCVYCYARPMHEYLEWSAGLDFETKILVKENAPQLLEKTLSSKTWKPQVIALSGATDPYQPAEKKFEISRKCLQVLSKFRNPVVAITKNYLATRDIDLFSQLAQHNASAIYISLNSLDASLARKMEPRASSPERRLETIRKFSEAKVPVGVLVAPVVPGLNDAEIPAVLNAAAEAGASFAGYVVLRLPFAVEELFTKWLEDTYPNKKEKVLNRLRSLRNGGLYNSDYRSRMVGEGVFAKQIADLFKLSVRKSGITFKGPTLDPTGFISPFEKQMTLFDDS
jgi:DNA repair photolyase